MLGALGLALGTFPTASSVAMMGSTLAEKAGSAGALEATSYGLGTSLGISGFGLALTSSYQNALRMPAEMPADLASSAGQSIGEMLIAAHSIGGAGVGARPLKAAGRQAFSSSHGMVLASAAVLIWLLTVVVFPLLRHYRDSEALQGAH